MDTYALGYSQRRSRSLTLGAQQLYYKKSVPPPIDPPVVPTVDSPLTDPPPPSSPDHSSPSRFS